MRWPRPSSRSAVIALAISVVAGCGVPGGDATPIASDDLPAALRTSTTSSTALPSDETGKSGAVTVYWIRDKLLVPEAIEFESVPDVERVVSLLERGPTSTERAPEVRSAVSQARVIRSVARDDERVIVELSDDFSEVVGSDQVLALGQIVATVTAVPGVTEVEFQRGGESLEVPVPDGSLVQRPVTRADYVSLLPSAPTNR